MHAMDRREEGSKVIQMSNRDGFTHQYAVESVSKPSHSGPAFATMHNGSVAQMPMLWMA